MTQADGARKARSLQNLPCDRVAKQGIRVDASRFFARIFLPSSVAHSTTPANFDAGKTPVSSGRRSRIAEEARQRFGSLSASYPRDSLISERKKVTCATVSIVTRSESSA